VVISSICLAKNSRFVGRSISDIAKDKGKDEIDSLCDLLVSENGKVGMILHSMSPQDVEQVLRLPYSSMISDSIYPPTGAPHPRLYGAFPNVIREFVCEKGVLTLPESIRKMTALPAKRLELTDRGMVKQGCIADLLLFHPGSVMDTATYTNPVQLAKGLNYVFIGGQAAIKNGILQDKRYGKFIKRQGIK
jgi:N-acyl-D-amino-acid deacylase